MEVMNLLKVIIILISISSLSYAGNLPKDAEASLEKMPVPIWIEDDQMNFPMFMWRTTQYISFRLSKTEKRMHQSAVFFMLNNAENGKIVSWYSDKREVSGKVRVIHSYPISSGLCRTYQAYIKVKGKSRHITNNACKYIGSPSWTFYK